MRPSLHKKTVLWLVAGLGLGHLVIPKPERWDPEKGGEVRLLASFDAPTGFENLEFNYDSEKTYDPADIADSSVRLQDIKEGKVIVYTPGEPMVRCEAVRKVQELLVQEAGVSLKIDGIAGPLTTSGIGTGKLGAARWYACSRGLKDRSGAITKELLSALETKLPALPLVTEERASLEEVALERLDINGEPVVFRFRDQDQIYCPGYRQAQLLMEVAGIDLGYYGADGYFGKDGYNRLLPTYLQSRGINAPTDRITAEVAQALMLKMPPLSVKLELKNLSKQAWFGTLDLSWQKAIFKFAASQSAETRTSFFYILNTEIFRDLNPILMRQALNVIFNCGENNLRLLAQVFSLKTYTSQKPFVLDTAYDKGRTPLISWLHEIACGKLDPQITDEMRPGIINSLIKDIIFPHTYAQDNHGTCAPIQVFKYFYFRYPGEAFRLAT
ncbi:MAG: hypothetical protein R3A13_06645 [Bdellovibrionota bacterium]